MPEQIIATGAEAILLRQNCTIIKRRIKKSYRLQEIDLKLRKIRTRAEARIIEKLQDKINVPKIIKVNEQDKEIAMQFIQGKKLSDYLDSLPIKKQLETAEEIGRGVSRMHDLGIIHGDLTTSNMILVDNLKDNKSIITPKPHNWMSKIVSNLTANNNFRIFFIDFGLSFHSSRIEDKAVDLHLLKQALESRHFQNWKKLFSSFLNGYNPEGKSKILNQLEKVESRGRYRKNA